jgi:hypothetical protein
VWRVGLRQSYAAQPNSTTTPVEIPVAAANHGWESSRGRPLGYRCRAPRTLPGSSGPSRSHGRLTTTSESNRPRRFALPSLDDERTDESIEAFLEGPDVRRHRPVARRWTPPGEAADTSGGAGDASQVAPSSRLRGGAGQVTAASRPAGEIRSIPGRLEWTAALERESLRAARYGRPAAVAIVQVFPDEDGRPAHELDRALRTLAGVVATALRRDSRATDLVARVGSGRFQVLLPETDEAGGGRYADRASAACRRAVQEAGGRASLRVSVAAASRDHSLQQAVTEALRSIEAA